MLNLTPLAAFYSFQALIGSIVTLFEKKFPLINGQKGTQHYCARTAFKASPFKSSAVVVAVFGEMQ
jgi:hypothetical protein